MIYSVLKLCALSLLMTLDETLSLYNKPWNEKYENNKCPKLYPKNFDNHMPVGKCLFISFDTLYFTAISPDVGDNAAEDVVILTWRGLTGKSLVFSFYTASCWNAKLFGNASLLVG